MAQYKIVVKHKGGSVSRYDFPVMGKVWDHYLMYEREVQDGLYISVMLFKLVTDVKTGEAVWVALAGYDKELANVETKD